MKVSEATKSTYGRPSYKYLRVYFPDIGLLMDEGCIRGETMNLVERTLDGKNIEFVGCISSVFEIQLQGITQNIKGQRIEVSITADDTEEIPLFKGIVDSALRQTNKQYKKIVAYDELYKKGNIDVAAWYNSLSFPTTLKDLRDSFFAYIGIEQEPVELPNDGMVLNKELAPTSLQARTVFKSICQINGAFGIINRYGKFEYRILTDIKTTDGAYPGLTLFPPFYPGVSVSSGGQGMAEQPISFYRKVDYEEYSVKPVERVTIRQTESDTGVSYGEGTNNYIIQGNMFTVNKSASELATIAQNIHGSIAGIEFVPFTSDNSGFPFIEVGLDAVSYYTYDFEASTARNTDVYTKKVFYVFNRTLKGIQALRDSYSVQGEEYQREFITDLQTQVETLKNNLSAEVGSQVSVQLEQKIPEVTYTKEEVDRLIAEIKAGMFGVKSVDNPPSNPERNTIYLIKGEVTVT